MRSSPAARGLGRGRCMDGWCGDGWCGDGTLEIRFSWGNVIPAADAFWTVSSVYASIVRALSFCRPRTSNLTIGLAVLSSLRLASRGNVIPCFHKLAPAGIPGQRHRAGDSPPGSAAMSFRASTSSLRPASRGNIIPCSRDSTRVPGQCHSTHPQACPKSRGNVIAPVSRPPPPHTHTGQHKNSLHHAMYKQNLLRQKIDSHAVLKYRSRDEKGEANRSF